MTACFVAQFGPLCLAAADTRLSVDSGSGPSASAWDSADLPVITAAGLDYVIPYRFRKIRQIDRGWAVTAGCYITGERMLNLLKREHAASAHDAERILVSAANSELSILEELSVDDDVHLYDSRLLGVPGNLDRTGVWIAQLDRTAGYTVRTAGEIAMNWPPTIPAAQQDSAQEAFFSAMHLEGHVPNAIRAAAALIGAARAAPGCSAVVQIGLTWQSSTGFQSRYFHGHVDDIATLTNDEIVSRWEVLPT